MDIQEFPVKLEELCSFSFNFENLIRIIEFLHKSHTQLANEVKDLSKKLLSLDDLKSQIGDLQIKNRQNEIFQKDTGETIKNLQSKILEIDSKMTNINDQALQTSEKIIKYDTYLTSHEDNINKLNKIVEENIKDSKSIDEEIKKCIEQNENNLSSIVKLEKEVEDINQKNLESKDLIQKLEDSKSELEQIKETVNRNNLETQNTFSNILQSISDLKQNGIVGGEVGGVNVTRKRTSVKNAPSNVTITDSEFKETNENVKFSQTQIENLQIKFEDLLNKYNKHIEEYDNDMKDLEKRYDTIENQLVDMNADLDDLSQIAKIQRRRSTIQLPNQNDNQNQDENKSFQKEFNTEINVENILNIFINSKEYKKLNDNLRIITGSIGDKIGRDEIDNFQKALNARISKIEDKINEFRDGGISIPNRLKNKNNIQGQGSGIDMEFLQQNIEAQINEEVKNVTIEFLKNESKGIDLSQNPSILNLMESITKNSDDINKNYKSIIDIRDMLITHDNDKQMVEIKKKLAKLDEDNRNSKAKLYELAKNLEGSEEEEDIPINPNPNENAPTVQEPHQSGMTFKEKINVLTATCQNLSEKVKVLEKKNQALTREVKDDIKQNLKNETQKVVDNFKLKLDSFSNKFEHELKNKIDHMGLSSFEHKMSNKFYGDLREKLDKNELRKNNNVINRKIDSLENKISKTLVDTIIDLQMDDQPLLLKKNAKNIDKCASCGQNLPIPYYDQVNMNQSASLNKTSKFKYTINNKDKLPDINEKGNS
jgi:chromosome segregation ATPase